MEIWMYEWLRHPRINEILIDLRPDSSTSYGVEKESKGKLVADVNGMSTCLELFYA